MGLSYKTALRAFCVLYFFRFDFSEEEETDSCQKGCKRKSGASEAAVESEENSEKKAKLDEAEEDPATAEPQFVEA